MSAACGCEVACISAVCGKFTTARQLFKLPPFVLRSTVCVRVRACVRARVHVCVCARVCACEVSHRALTASQSIQERALQRKAVNAAPKGLLLRLA